jgi:hypothetical protein
MLQRPDIARDALTMKDPAPLEVVPFGDSGRGEACISSIARVSPSTATLDLTAQQ